MEENQSRFSTHELTDKQILIRIEDEKEFQQACNLSKNMKELCEHNDLYQNRLKYWLDDETYKILKEFKDDSELSWKIIYHLYKYSGVDFMANYIYNLVENKVFEFEDLDFLFGSVNPITQKFIKLLDYNIKDLLIALVVLTIEKENIKLFKELIEFDLDFNFKLDINEFLMHYGTPSFIVKFISSITLNKEDVEEKFHILYSGNSDQFNSSKSLEFIKEWIKTGAPMGPEIIAIAVKNRFFSTADFLLQQFSKDEISLSLTKDLLRHLDDEDLVLISKVVYMITRNIKPIFEILISYDSIKKRYNELTSTLENNLKTIILQFETAGVQFDQKLITKNANSLSYMSYELFLYTLLENRE